MRFLAALRRVIGEYWAIGDRWQRGSVIYLILHPFVITAVALIGLKLLTELWAFLPGLPFVILLVASPVLTEAFLAEPITRHGLQALALVVGAEIAYGWYLVLVPVRNDVALSFLPLLTLVGVVALAFGRPTRFSRFAIPVGLGFFGLLTAVFILGGRECIKTDTKKGADTARCLFGSKPDSAKIGQGRNPTPAAESRVMELELQAGDTARGPEVGPGSHHEIWSDHQFLVVAARVEKGDTVFQTYVMPAGSSSWNGGAPKGTLRLKGLHDSTVVRFTRSS